MDRGIMDGKLRVLELYRFYRELDTAFQTEILRAASEVHLAKGTIVFDPGVHCAHVALVGAGSLRVFIGSDSGREVTLYHVGPGETCPINLLSALMGKAVPATAIVESALHAVTLPSSTCRIWMDMQPKMRDFLLDGLAVRFLEIFQQVNEITFGKLDQRLTEYLMKRFAESTETPPEVKATHEHIASQLSTAREVISRLLREFELSGAVDLGRGRITLRDKKKLEMFR